MTPFGRGNQPVARGPLGGRTVTGMRDTAQVFGGSPNDAQGAPVPAYSQGQHTPGQKAYWSTAEQVLSFALPTVATYGPTAGVFTRAVYQTPLFDLRPDLGISSGYEPQGQGVGNVLFGEYLNLFLRARTNQFDAYEYRVYSQEFGAPTNPDAQGFVAQREDITLAFMQGYSVAVAATISVDTILRWRASGPLRYWGTALIIDRIDNAGGAAPVVRVSGAMH